VYSDTALTQVAVWLRRLHDTTEAYAPQPGAVWMAGQSWHSGLVIGHNDAAPYNAVWCDGRLAGFVDWDTAGPSSRDTDLAFAALWWVPLHARHVAAHVGFDAFDDRRRRLHLFLDAYGYTADRLPFGAAVAARARLNATVLRRLAANGEPTYTALLPMTADLETAAEEVEALPTSFWHR
jgi:thiamine kinase-like enzyme